MKMRRLCWTLLFLAGGRVFAQIETDTITVSASRQVNLQPDQIVFAVDVQSGLDTGLDKVLAALQGSGITSSDFSGVFFVPAVGGPAVVGPLDWGFTLPIALSSMRATIATLTALQQTLAKGQVGLTLTFNLQGTQVSQEAQASGCSNSALISDAQAQAQNMANAAGFSVGPILSVSTTPASSSAVGTVYAFTTISSTLVPVLPTIGAVPTNLVLTRTMVPPTTCSATVKFRLLRYH